MNRRQHQHRINVYTGLLGTGASVEQIADLVRRGDLLAGQAAVLRAQPPDPNPPEPLGAGAEPPSGAEPAAVTARPATRQPPSTVDQRQESDPRRVRPGGTDGCTPAPASSGPVDAVEQAHRTLLASMERQAVLAAGLAWLYHRAQPDGAIVHHGPSLATGERAYTFHPVGHHGSPVVVVNVRHPRYDDRGDERVLTNPLHGTELAEVADALTVLGVTVVDRWNGTHETGSLRLAEPAHPSLLAAHRRYRAQCPQHHTVFCDRARDRGGHDCPWYRDGAALLVAPAHPLGGDPPVVAVETAGSGPLVTVTAPAVVTAPGDDDEARCRVCGCTENTPCPGGCRWVPDPTMRGRPVLRLPAVTGPHRRPRGHTRPTARRPPRPHPPAPPVQTRRTRPKGTRRGPVTIPKPNTDAAVSVLLAEYEQLKDEQRARIGFRDNFIYVNLGAIAAIGYAAFQQHVAQFLLAIPLACFVLGWTYLSNDRMITELGRYFRDTLTPQLTALVGYRDVLGWEHERPADPRRTQRKWIQLAVDLAAFCAPPTAVIVLLVRAGISLDYRYGQGTWLMLAVATCTTTLLAWQFVTYAEVTLPRGRRRRPGPASTQRAVLPDRPGHEPGS